MSSFGLATHWAASYVRAICHNILQQKYEVSAEHLWLLNRELEGQLEQVKRQDEHLHRSLDQVQQQCKVDTEALQKINHEQEDEIKEVRRKNEELQEKSDELQKNNEELQKKNEELRQKNGNIEEEVEGNRRSIERLNRIIRHGENMCEDLRWFRDRANTNLETAKAQHKAELKKLAERMENDLNLANQGHRSRLRDVEKKYEVELNQLEERIENDPQIAQKEFRHRRRIAEGEFTRKRDQHRQWMGNAKKVNAKLKFDNECLRKERESFYEDFKVLIRHSTYLNDELERVDDAASGCYRKAMLVEEERDIVLGEKKALLEEMGELRERAAQVETERAIMLREKKVLLKDLTNARLENKIRRMSF